MFIAYLRKEVKILKIPFHKPTIPKNINGVYNQSIRDGWLTTGPNVMLFEKKLSKLLKVENVVAVNSCTAALHLALAAKEYSLGDKFIVPTYTFVASIEVGEYLGMEPILIDCDENFNIDINKIESIVKNDSSVKAIIPVHFAGKPVDMKSINFIAEKYNLFVLEDAAHALETISNEGKVGDTNNAAAFSFYANKNITTAGEGGALTTNDEKYAKKIRKLSLHGMSKDGWKRFKIGNKWEYDVSDLGYKYNLTDMAASFGAWQLDHLEEWYNKRVAIFNNYNEYFKNINGIICPNIVSKIEKDAYHLYIIRLVPHLWSITRNEFIEKLSSNGIGTSVHYKPVHLHSYYSKKYDFNKNDFLVAEDYYNNVISLPIYPELSKNEIKYIIDVVLSLWSKYKK